MSMPPYATALASCPQGQRILGRDWSHHDLGPVEQWDEGLLAALAQMLPVAVPAAVIWGPSARLFFNAAFEQAFPERNLVQGQAVGDIADPLWKALISYRPGVSEISLTVGGVVGWWQLAQSPLSARSGDIAGRLVLMWDISSHRLAEQALAASEETLLSLMDGEPKFLWRCDPAGHPVWINRLGLQFLGMETVRGADVARAILVPDQAVLLAELQHGLHHKQAVEVQVRLRSAERGVRYCLMHFVPLMDARGRIQAWSGEGVDVHDWHEAAAAARLALPPLPDGQTARPHFDRYGRQQLGFIVDVEKGRLRPLLPRSGEPWGLSRDGPPVLVADWLMRLRPHQRERADDSFSLAAEGQVAEDVWTLTLPDGTERSVHAMLFPVPDPDGTVRRIGGILSPAKELPEQRVYFIDLDPPDPGQSCEIQRALALLGLRVKRFESLEAFAVVLRDLRSGAVVIRTGRSREPVHDALDMLFQNRERFPWMVLSRHDMPVAEVVQIMQHGAKTVIPAAASRTEIFAAVRAAIPADPLVEKADTGTIDRLEGLTRRERQVLDGLLAGGTNKTIAAQLGLSPRTVEAHRAHLMDRLDARSLADLIRIVGPQYMAMHARKTG